MRLHATLSCLLLLSGCAGTLPFFGGEAAEEAAPPPAAETAPPQPPSIVLELYDDMDTAVATYRQGLALIEEGSVSAGEERIEAALVALEDAAGRCRLVEGCGLEEPLAAYQRIVGLQADVFATGEPGAAEPEALEAEPEGSDPALRPVGGRTLNGVDLAELIELNGYVKDAIHDWLTWNRPQLIRTYENYQFLRPHMLPPYEEAGLPEALLFGILAVESQGRVHSYSRAGAAGPMQFMRATAQRYGLKDSYGFDERLDPAKVSRASVAYLNDQFRRLGESLEKTLAAYNAGENRLLRLDRRYPDADFWSSEFFFSLPRDTRRYVPQVLGAAWLYLHPEDHGLHWPEYPAGLAELVLEREISLSELSICLGNDGFANGWFRALRNLNPQHNPGKRLPLGTRLTVPASVAEQQAARCSDPRWLALAGDLRDASENRESEFVPYRVRSGDTLSLIASRHRCISMKELAAINDISPPRYLIRAGKTLKVPSC